MSSNAFELTDIVRHSDVDLPFTPEELRNLPAMDINIFTGLRGNPLGRQLLWRFKLENLDINVGTMKYIAEIH